MSSIIISNYLSPFQHWTLWCLRKQHFGTSNTDTDTIAMDMDAVTTVTSMESEPSVRILLEPLNTGVIIFWFVSVVGGCV